ncbi:MAG: mechanosensitive ion channel family protein [Candidatus Promineifilaceae bacterium]|nr:mechanosensitive ion channel family protein [Candidatus Promineifilaceae bacterium]
MNELTTFQDIPEVLSPLTEWLLVSGLRIVLILVLAIVGYRLFLIIGGRLAARIKALDNIEGSLQDRRIETIFHLITTAGLFAVGTVAILMILLELGVEVAPLLASVGVVGLALGLGAQQLVEDVIAGLFIFIENHYMVGEVIAVDNMVGVVEEVTLRVTRLRALNGDLHIIPNGEIRTVSNRTRIWSRAIVDVGITYEDDVDRAIEALEDVGRLLMADEEMRPLIVDEPTVTGIEGLEDWQIRLRLMVKTRPDKRLDVERYLRHEIQRLFDERGLTLASPRQEVVIISTE